MAKKAVAKSPAKKTVKKEAAPKVAPKKKANYVLVQYDGDGIEAFSVMPKAEWEEYTEQLHKVRFPSYVEFGDEIGSLEVDSADNYLESCEVKDLTDEEYAVLNKFFPYTFGNFPWVDTDERDEESESDDERDDDDEDIDYDE